MKIFLVSNLCGEYDGVYEKDRTLVMINENDNIVTAEDVLKRHLIKKNPFFNESCFFVNDTQEFANYFGEEMVDDDGDSIEILVREIKDTEYVSMDDFNK